MNIIGKMLNNRYEILEKIGNGGMATVYKAKCHVLNRYVAIKILKEEFTTDSEFIKKFKTEAQSAASLTHPNIVSIYDVCNEDNLNYIVMELIQGKTLKDIIIEDGVLSWKWSVNIATQIASALDAAHKHNIIHRDIKPHNIMITEDGIAKVADFGIAKAVSNSTITAFGTTIGSVHYFSPEHARGGFTDAKSDIYSLGIVMYEMLTGRVPFDADTPVSVALKQVQEEPEDPMKFNKEIPLGVNRIILKAMQKDPNLRYQSAADMVTDLKMALKKPNEDFVVLATRNENSPTQRVPTIYELEMENSNERKAPKNDGKEEKKENIFKRMGNFLNKHKALKVLLILLICGCLFAGALFGTITFVNNARPQEVVMPDLSGTVEGNKRMTKEAATAALTELGFTHIKYVEEYSEEIEEGFVIKQEPKFQENYKLNVTKEITLTVSKGQKIVTLPKKIVGKQVEEIKTELDKLELNYNEIPETSEEVEKGIILSVDPEEGAEISASTIVNLTVSAGSQYKDVSVPNVLNKSEAEARTMLAEFSDVEVTYTEDADKSDGIVTSQNIQAGKTVKENEKIVITVNKQPKQATVTVVVNLKGLLNFVKEPVMENVVSTQKTSGKVEILVGTDKILSETKNFEETNISASYTGSGVKEIKVIVDGVTKSSGKKVDFNQGDQYISIP